MRFHPLILSLLPLSVPLAGQEPGVGVQRLDNPGGESKVAVRVGTEGGQPVFDVPSWDAESGDWVAQSGPWSKIEPVDGEAFLRPRDGDRPVLSQTVSLAEEGAPAPRFVLAGAFVRTMAGKDGCGLRLICRDAALVDLAEASTGEVRDRTWTWREVFVQVPRGTAYVTLELQGYRNDGKFADAFFDGAVLEGLGPGLPLSTQGSSVADLGAELDGEIPWAERRAALRALAVDRSGVKVLVDRVESEQDPALRRTILTLLALVGGRAAEAPLTAALGAADADLRAHARALLPWTGSAGAKLLAPFVDDPDPKVRIDAMRALAVAGDAKALQRASQVDADRALEVMRAIRETGAEVRPFYRGLLAPWLDAGAEAKLRDEAMRVLGRAGDDRFLKHLEDLAPAAGSQGRLAEWFRMAAAFGTKQGVDAVLSIVADGVAHADRALLEVAGELGQGPGLLWARKQGVRDENPSLRLAAVRVLRAGGDAADLGALRAATEDADALVAVEAVEAVGARGDGDAVELLERLFTRAPGPVAAAALRALYARADGDADAVQRAMGAATAHQTWEARAAGLDLLAGAGAEQAFPVILAAFQDKIWQVRAAAYRAAGAVRTRRSVESLITRIGDERGAARTFLADALVDLTGVDHGDAPDGWQKWWGIVGASFEVPPRVAKKAGDAPVRPRTVASYYGIPLRTDSMVFIIDLSGSMTAKVGEKTKLRAAQDQLIAVLRKLQPTQKFGLIGFGTDVGAWEPALVPASPKNVDEAVAWVERLAIRGSTNIYDSLERALAFEGVESIFLLSDGGPSAGRFVAMDQIRAAVRVQNRDQRVRINTILIGGSAREQDFMRKLAGENDGEVGRPDADRGTR
ncbi:MAG: hypothetical protein RL562_2137 [Planctomycetota bacterium]